MAAVPAPSPVGPRTPPPPLRVIVVGAGIGGLASAVALHSAGHDVTVLERATEPLTGGGHLGIQSNAVLALRALGLDPVRSLPAVAVERFELRSWGGSTLAWWSPGEVGRELAAPNITVPRQGLLDELAARLTDCEIRRGALVEKVTQEDDRVTAHLSGGERLTGDVLVAADGLHSRVRRSLGLRGQPLYAGYTAWRGASPVRPAGLAPATAHHYLGQGATFGCWPLPNGRTYWVATSVEPESEGTTRQGPPERLLRRAPRTVRELLAAAEESEVLRTPIHALVATGDLGRGRVVLLGDAAHCMQPTTGQGAGQALLDALCLAGHLAGATDVPGALAGYVHDRQSAVRRVAGEAADLGRMHHVRNTAGRLLRDTIIRATPHRVWQQRNLMRVDERRLLAEVTERRTRA